VQWELVAKLLEDRDDKAESDEVVDLSDDEDDDDDRSVMESFFSISVI
jgi:hypothetical protein